MVLFITVPNSDFVPSLDMRLLARSDLYNIGARGREKDSIWFAVMIQEPRRTEHD